MDGEQDKTRWRGVRPVYGISGVWPAIGSVRVFASQSQLILGETEFYTVSAGKRFYISGISLSVRQSVVQSGKGYIRIRNAADVSQYSPMYIGMETAGQIALAQPFFPAIELPELWDVTIKTDIANLAATAMVFGWVEDA